MTLPARDASSPTAPSSSVATWELLLLALVLTGGLLALQARLNFNFADEGFLWYGAAQTAHGAVPMRDFYGYDPGRYYWAAAFMGVLGDGIVALRVANAAFQVLGLWCGLLVARRLFRTRTALVATAALLLVWMYPRHKLYESALAMMAVWVLTHLLERPTRARHFAAGAFVALAAFFGKNHALYAGLACAALLSLRFAEQGWFSWRARLPEWLAFTLGGICGALPLVAMFAAVPGFFDSYLRIIHYFSDAGRTNQPVPFPWPWKALTLDGPWAERTLLAGAGVGLLALPFAYLPALTSAWRGLRNRREDVLPARAVLLASGAVGVFYMHHAYARTDSFHLAQAIHPALLATLAAATAWRARAARFAGLAAVAVFTLCGAVPDMPLVQKAFAFNPGDRYVDARVGNDAVQIPARAANMLAATRRALEELGCGPTAILPHLPGLYPAMSRTAPMWDIYPIWPAQGERDRRMLAELQQRGTDCVLLDSYSGPGEPAWQDDYPETAAWVRAAFTPVSARAAGSGLPRSLRLFQRADTPAH